MNRKDKVNKMSLFCVIFSMVAMAIAFAQNVRHGQTHRMIRFTGWYFLAVFLVNLASQRLTYPQMTPWDLFFYGMIAALQSFTLDASYDVILQAIYTEGAFAYLYSTLILMCAPIVGGAAVLNILADIFPEFRYWYKTYLCRRVVIFSSLDDNTFGLAAEMASEAGRHSSVRIVFANTAANEGEEDERNQIEEARRRGWICLKDGIGELKLNWRRPLSYVLAREDEERNLQDALQLASHREGLWSRATDTEIWVYTHDSSAPELLEQAFSRYREEKTIRLRMISPVTMTVYRLLSEYPLYDAFVRGPQQEEAYTVAILGTDAWAENLFRTVYWCGQILNKHLNIHLISPDAERFARHIHAQIPELEENDGREAYCQVAFEALDPESEAFEARLMQQPLRDCRIWYVSLGADRRNIAVAMALGRRLRAIHLTESFHGWVHYVVNNNALTASLQAWQAGSRDGCTLHPFGSVQDLYSGSNQWGILHDFAWMINNAWQEKKGEFSAENEYKRRSSLAAALHIQYKLYSGGFLAPNLCPEQLPLKIRESLHLYLQAPADQARDYAIGYNEHRRWNAYMRSSGYRSVLLADWVEFCRNKGEVTSRDKASGLHVCLTDFEGPEPVSRLKDQDWEADLPQRDPVRFAQLDGLDRVSWQLHQLKEEFAQSRYEQALSAWRAGGEKSEEKPTREQPWKDDYKMYDIQALREVAEKYEIYSIIEEWARENGRQKLRAYLSLRELAPGRKDRLALLDALRGKINSKGAGPEAQKQLAQLYAWAETEPEALETLTVEQLTKRLALAV